MDAEYAEVTTADDLHLSGMVFRPTGDPVGAVVLMHGMGGSRMEHEFNWWLAQAVTEAGWLCIAGDNRGAGAVKDIVDSAGTPHRYGAAKELLVEAPIDVAAWCAAVPSSIERIVLVGHSLGASKVTLGHDADPRIAAVALLSPADMVAIAFSSHDYERALRDAEHLIAEGRGDRELDDFLYGEWTPISAQTLWERRARGTAGDVIDASDPDAVTPIGAIAVPVLAVIGGADPLIMIDPTTGLQNLAAQTRAAPSFETYVIEGADHHFTGAREQLVTIVTGFLEELADAS